MAQPQKGDQHVSTLLTGMSVAYTQDPKYYVSDKVFPVVPVNFQGNKYATYPISAFIRDGMQLRPPGAESAGGGYDVTTSATYYCDHYGFHKDVDGDTRNNATAPFNPDMDAMRFVSDKGLLKKEILFAANYMAGSKWGADKQGGVNFTKWDDDASDPEKDIKDQNDVIHGITGRRANKFVCGQKVWTALSRNPSIKDLVKYGQTPGSPAMVTKEAVAAIFEVDEVLVMGGIYETAKEGQTSVPAFIGGKKALLVYAAPNPGLMTPSGGYTFAWTGREGAGAGGQRIKKYFMEQNDADRVEIDLWVDLKLVAASLGIYYYDCVA